MLRLNSRSSCSVRSRSPKSPAACQSFATSGGWASKRTIMCVQSPDHMPADAASRGLGPESHARDCSGKENRPYSVDESFTGNLFTKGGRGNVRVLHV